MKWKVFIVVVWTACSTSNTVPVFGAVCVEIWQQYRWERPYQAVVVLQQLWTFTSVSLNRYWSKDISISTRGLRTVIKARARAGTSLGLNKDCDLGKNPKLKATEICFYVAKKPLYLCIGNMCNVRYILYLYTGHSETGIAYAPAVQCNCQKWCSRVHQRAKIVWNGQ